MLYVLFGYISVVAIVGGVLLAAWLESHSLLLQFLLPINSRSEYSFQESFGNKTEIQFKCMCACFCTY